MSATGRLLLGFGVVFATAVILVGGALAVRPPAAASQPLPDPQPVFSAPDDSLARELEQRRQQARDRIVRRLSDSESGPIRCRLRVGAPTEDLILELVNTSPAPLRLWHGPYGLIYHVTVVLLDADGRLASFLRWTRLTSFAVLVNPTTGRPIEELPVCTLLPGEVQRHLVSYGMLHDLMGARVNEGRYGMQALFDYADLGGFPEPNQELFARSGLIPVIIAPDGMRLMRE
jgi:hypothetical protein